MTRVRAALVPALFLALACSSGTKYLGAYDESREDAAACAPPVPPPASLGLDPFYERYVDAHGVPVVSSAHVGNTALARACDMTLHVLEKRADVHAALVENGLRVVVIARSEVMTDIPEYYDLYEALPGLDWDNVGRSVGPFAGHPLASASEENFLCLEDDLFAGETMLLHSFGHGLRTLGILAVNPAWEERLEAAYDDAIAAGLWADTHAGTTPSQYFAEGVQDWYDANREVPFPDPMRLHNEINTRVELRAYDPALAALIAEYVPDDDWRPACLATR